MAHLPSTPASASASTSTSTSASAAASPNTNYNSHFDVFINCSDSDVTNNFASHLFHRLLDRGFRAFLDRPEVQPGDRLDSRIGGAIATACHFFRRLLDRGFRAFLDRPEVQPGDRLDSRIGGAIATACHLFRPLLDGGFRAFLDLPEVQPGDRLDSRIEGAIATASVHILIFSPKYAQSKRCLDELLLILKSKAPIVPVFYDVKPPELRIRTGEGQEELLGQILRCLVDNNGVYDEALRGHEKERSCSQQTIADWRKALSDVSQLNGLELEACEGDEGELVDRILQRAEEEVAKPQFQVGKYVIGMDKKLEDIEKAVLLQRQQHKGKAKFVGIVGVGGVGKTTLATEFFNRKRSAYHRSCFLSDVREAAGRSSLPSLQSKLIKDLTTLDHEIVSVAEGKQKLSNSLLYFKFPVLVILEDVDNVDQMDALYSPLKDVLESGSLILVTSRNKDVLKMSGMRESDIYNLTGLDGEHSQELFCLHAFHKRLPAFRFKEVVPKFLDVCGGLPLCLKVLGALVYQKDLKYWKTPLRKISLVLPADVQSILKISHDSLDDQEKDTFLDIACFLNGEDRDTVISIWDASGWVGWLNLQNLVNKCFVDIDNKSRIRMHHHLIDLGRDLAEKNPSRFRRRLWRPNENHFDNAWKNSTVRGINMIEVSSGKSVKDAVEVDMSTVQLLKAEGDCLESISNLLEHSDLLWLSWNHCPDYSLPSWIPRRNLRFLRVAGSKLETLWLHESEAPLNLRELIIDAPNFQIPKSIGQLKCLEKIELRCTMETLPDEFFHVTSLKNLRMYTSGKSLTLPDSFGNLTNLRDLDLSRCSHLRELPNSLGSLTALQQFDLSRCKLLQTLPDSLSNLTGLQRLNMSHCSNLQTLPDSLGNLTGLQWLNMANCSLQTLPNSLGNLTGLQWLNMANCDRLQTLPDSLGNLTGLQQLDLSRCSLLQKLPESVGNLTGLQQLGLSSCSRLQTLPASLGNLTGLQELNLSSCFELQTLPDALGNLTGLQQLDLSRCFQLQKLPESLGNLTGLQQLDLSGCEELKKLPESVGNLTGLQQLDLSRCFQLQALPDSLGNLTGLQQLDLSRCFQLQALPDSLGNLTGLQQLGLSSCSRLQTLPDALGNLTGLQQLDLSRCFQLQALPDSLWNLTGLQQLDLSGCEELQKLPESVGNLTGLQQLDLSRCCQLQALPDSLGNLTGLQRLNLSGCFQLRALPDSIQHEQRISRSHYKGGH